jgi:hypothetical protein
MKKEILKYKVCNKIITQKDRKFVKERGLKIIAITSYSFIICKDYKNLYQFGFDK